MPTIKELRSHRIDGIALFDLISAYIGLTIIFLICKKYYFPNLNYYPFLIAAFLLTIPVGILFHVLFGTNTTINYRLGLSNKPEI